MEKSITNSELNLAFFYWEGKQGRLFLASQIMNQLGYLGGSKTLFSYDLEVGKDMITFEKKLDKALFIELTTLSLLGQRAGKAIMLSESGVWKLVMQSRKKIGIQTRNWLATQVLPSIKETGKYEIADFANNPIAHLSKFTENTVQKKISKSANSIVYKGDKNWSEVWNEVHKMVVGLDAKGIKKLYQSTQSAKEILRLNLPHLEATEAIIMELWNKGVGLEKIRESKLHETMPPAINSLFKLGIRLENL